MWRKLAIILSLSISATPVKHTGPIHAFPNPVRPSKVSAGTPTPIQTKRRCLSCEPSAMVWFKGADSSSCAQ